MVERFSALANHPRVWVNLPPPAFDNIYGISGSTLGQVYLPALEQCASRTQASMCLEHFDI